MMTKTTTTIALLALALAVSLAVAEAQQQGGQQRDQFHAWCKQHPRNSDCESYIRKECKNNPNHGFCGNFLRSTCPEKSNKPFCHQWCKDHPKKCPHQHNPCVHKNHGSGGLGATANAVRSDDAGNGPSRDDITAAFNSFAADEAPAAGQLGAQRQPTRPGFLPMKDLKPLLTKLGVRLSPRDMKLARKQLNQGGEFSLTGFFFWWSEYVICNAAQG